MNTNEINTKMHSVKCFKCSDKFLLKWVRPRKDFSKKNNLDYWTEKKEDKGKYVCDKCLRKIYHEKREYWKLVTNLKKRQTMTAYINRNVIENDWAR